MALSANIRAQLLPVVRHECGHLFVARTLGFPTGGIELWPGREAGAEIELQFSLKSIPDLLEYIEKRVQVLYAGAIAESIQGDSVRPEVAKALLDSPKAAAGHDFAKIKELLRVWAAFAYPDVPREQFLERVKALETRCSLLYSRIYGQLTRSPSFFSNGLSKGIVVGSPFT
jgi:hypothetical protein